MPAVIRTRWRALAIVLALLGTLAITSTTVGSSTAQAGSPIVWNHTGGSIPLYFAPNQNYSNVKTWMPNSSHFYMTCWIDNTWYYGNYWSNRWFGGWSASGYWGYTPASYVYYQVWTPHC